MSIILKRLLYVIIYILSFAILLILFSILLISALIAWILTGDGWYFDKWANKLINFVENDLQNYLGV